MTDSPERKDAADADRVSTEETPMVDDAAVAWDEHGPAPLGEAPVEVADAPADAAPAPAPEPESQPAPAPVGPVTEALAASSEPTGPASTPTHAAARPSALERVRENRMGPLAVTLGVGIVVALLLAVLVPGSPNLYAYALLGALVTAAVGFTARYLAAERGWEGIATGVISAVIAVHVMAVTGTVQGSGPGAILEQLGAQGPGYDDGVLAALATPAVSTGGLLAGLVAGIVVGWGKRGPE